MSRKFIATLVIAVLCSFSAATAGASTINISNSFSGWYDNTGNSDVLYSASLGELPSGNYVAGDAFGFENHNYFVFDLTALASATIISAQLQVWSYDVSTNGTFTTYEVATDPTVVSSGLGGVPVFDDLADGPDFGSTPMPAYALTLDPLDQGYLVTVDLNLAAIAAIQAATGGLFAIGGNFSSGSEDYGFGLSEFNQANKLVVEYRGDVAVPDGGITFSLLGGTMIAIGMLRRRLSK
jgi:hypothetical protein